MMRTDIIENRSQHKLNSLSAGANYKQIATQECDIYCFRNKYLPSSMCQNDKNK